MIERYFVSDVHLNENEPAITAGFIHFLSTINQNAELYILGDLFDYWIGDDLLTDEQQKIVDAIQNLKEKNIKCFFIHGNRDFLIGKDFAKLTHIKILDDFHFIKNADKTILILHGDLLCLDDKSYLRFRKFMHNKLLQFLFLNLPVKIRLNIANKLRNKSQNYNNKKLKTIMDVNLNYVKQLAQKHHVDVIIHGHTHILKEHSFTIQNKIAKRVVMGAWHDSFNYVYQNPFGDIKLVAIQSN